MSLYVCPQGYLGSTRRCAPPSSGNTANRADVHRNFDRPLFHVKNGVQDRQISVRELRHLHRERMNYGPEKREGGVYSQGRAHTQKKMTFSHPLVGTIEAIGIAPKGRWPKDPFVKPPFRLWRTLKRLAGGKAR